jgi:thiopeptide-type bacteriocin biosynthesis protein
MLFFKNPVNPEGERRSRVQQIVADKATRVLLPGQQWVYMKIYTGIKTADHILHTVLGPMAKEMLAAGTISSFFFIRYRDDAHHIRFRVAVKDTADMAGVIASMNELLTPYIGADRIWKVQLDTYMREMERYGNIGLAETIFHHDSLTCLDILQVVTAKGDENLRWMAGMAGVDNYLDLFGLTLAEKETFALRNWEGFQAEFGVDAALKKRLNTLFRQQRGVMERVSKHDGDHPYNTIQSVIRERNGTILHTIREISATGVNKPELSGWISSYVHMYLNRLFRGNQRMHEFVIYYLLQKQYKSLLMR